MKKVYGVKEGPLGIDAVLFVCDKKEDAEELARAISPNSETADMVTEFPVVASVRQAGSLMRGDAK